MSNARITREELDGIEQRIKKAPDPIRQALAGYIQQAQQYCARTCRRESPGPHVGSPPTYLRADENVIGACLAMKLSPVELIALGVYDLVRYGDPNVFGDIEDLGKYEVEQKALAARLTELLNKVEATCPREELHIGAIGPNGMARVSYAMTVPDVPELDGAQRWERYQEHRRAGMSHDETNAAIEAPTIGVTLGAGNADRLVRWLAEHEDVVV
jgi:hypothetical protein